MKAGMNHKQHDQRGIISIMVTMVMMIIISLIVIGLAQISRREQRQSLDDQLSTQAFYAAESGVNDAVQALRGGTVFDKTTCGNDTHYQFNNQLSTEEGVDVQYTCLTIDPTPTSLTQPLSTTPSVFPLTPQDGNALNTITLSWTINKNSSIGDWVKCPVTANVPRHIFSKVGNWACPYGVLRFDLVPATNMTRAGLIADTMTAFVVPTGDASASGTDTYGSGKQGIVYAAANCKYQCKFTVSGLTANRYYLRVSELYGAGQLTVTPRAGAQFLGAQAVIDSTGKAQDELRRVRVVVDLSGSNQNSGGSAPLISGDAVCKRYTVYVDGVQDDASNYTQCDNN